ncbi:MAG TPA: sigma-70 family RNA polymerase sigma factor [Planctomycetota bacterium]|nr:sigma-70 family RNA polymerase sigma factor [Planctomycetota bacterium]
MDDIPSDDECAWTRRARAGDRPAFDELVRRHQGRLRAWLAVRVADAAAVDDLAQDAFVIAYGRLDVFDPTCPFYPWLRGIALNVLRNHRRKAAAQPIAEDRLHRLLDEADERRPDDDEEADPDALARLRACIERLPDGAGELVRAHYFRGLALGELADARGRTAGAMAMLLLRARRWLRTCLERGAAA